MPLSWVLFLALIVALLVLDLFVLHRRAHVIRLREAALLSVGWVTLGLSFSGLVYAAYAYNWFGVVPGQAAPSDAAIQYLTGYLLEKSLSVDNIFVIAMLFTSLKVPPQYRHRILYWGILGAIILRGIMILGGSWLITRFDWLFYLFGLYLAYTGIKLLKPEAGEVDADSSALLRLARRILPIAKEEHGGSFLSREGGRIVVTQLGLALLAIEATDVIFALDSIPAVFSVTTDPFIVFTSNIFAILGLRSLYFILVSMLDRFRHLKVALAFILVFIGAKMLLHDAVDIGNLVSLGVIAGALMVGILSSILVPPPPHVGEGQ
ncbi:MAG: TerC family protein [Polyangiaceae bacterium]|nr:TerC family protein [Polyangiaceae bacterium]